MKRVAVVSSNIKTIGFNKNILEIEFKNGNVYQYTNVPSSIYESLMRSDSKGKFLSMFIKNKYPYQKVEKIEDKPKKDNTELTERLKEENKLV